MANIIVLDDESLSRERLAGVLSDERQHKLWIADCARTFARHVKEAGSALDLLIIDVSIIDTVEPGMLDLFRATCPQAGILVLTHTLKHPAGRKFQLLRKPFTDQDLVDNVNRVLNENEALYGHAQAAVAS